MKKYLMMIMLMLFIAAPVVLAEGDDSAEPTEFTLMTGDESDPGEPTEFTMLADDEGGSEEPTE